MTAENETIDQQLFDDKNHSELEMVVCNFEDDENKELCLSEWQRNLIVSSLEECLEQITTILRKTSLKKSDIDLSFVPTDVRYLDLIKSRLLYTSEERALKDMETEAVFQKLQNDCSYAVSVLEDTVQELRSSGTFSIMTKIPKKVTEMRAKESSVLFKARKNIEALKSLKELFAQGRLANEFEMKESAEKLAAALREFEIRGKKGRASIAYVSAWEKARCEQNIARCKIAEKDLRGTLEKLELDEKNENRITKDIEAFLCHNIEKNQEQIINWQNRYDRECADYKNAIGKLEKQINMERKVIKKFEEEQGMKQDFIDTYLAEKEADRKKTEHEEHVRNSTIKIQAWWRGVMVRRKLGQYRPEEKKKKRNTKSKK